MSVLRKPALLLSLLLAAFTPGVVVGADNVVVVLSSDLKPYKEALAGFEQQFEGKITTFVLSEKEPELPSGTTLVLAIGGKAASYAYPDNIQLVYCLAPGLNVRGDNYESKPIKIYTSPSLATIVSRFKQIDPKLQRLGIPWISGSIKQFTSEHDAVIKNFGVDVVSQQLQNAEDLPDYLRGIKGKVDALWLPPDPVLINPASLSILKSFSWANDIPFFVPTEGLVEQGATGSVASSFDEMGRAAANVVSAVIKGVASTGLVHPEKVLVTINLRAAKESNCEIPAEVLKAADRIIE